jgi:glutamine kinase
MMPKFRQRTNPRQKLRIEPICNRTIMPQLKTNVIFLGAGKPFHGEEPQAIRKVQGQKAVLDWLMATFEGLQPQFHFVAGYHFEEVISRYSDLTYYINPDWKNTGSAHSFLMASLDPDRVHFVSYIDILYRPWVAQRLNEMEEDLALCVDRSWRDRYDARSARDRRQAEKVILEGQSVKQVGVDISEEQANAEFAGLARLSPRAVAFLRQIREQSGEEYRQKRLVDLFDVLIQNGFKVTWLDVSGNWTEFNAPQDLARFVLGTKAETLERLSSRVKHSRISPSLSLLMSEWKDNRARCLEQIQQNLGGRPLAVRSSSLDEDNWKASSAGVYSSFLNVDSADQNAIARSVDEVIGSYENNGCDHQILIQEMIPDLALSGVAFTRSLGPRAPYYIINYDDSSRATDTVTGGTGRDLQTLVRHRDTDEPVSGANPLIKHLFPALHEVETLVGHDSLDIEFAIDVKGTVYLLQARPIVVGHHAWPVSDHSVNRALDQAEQRLQEIGQTPSWILGKQTLFGNMPDWNPAEIIGIRPRRLALGLYCYLVTDEVWAIQRAEYGYRDVRPQKLMTVFCGHPYIDVRASFNSFIPAELEDELAEKLVDHYLEHLADHPWLHDKIEFDISLTCRTLDFPEKSARLLETGFSKDEIDRLETSLRNLTLNAFDRVTTDLGAIETLKQRYTQIMAKPFSPLDRALILLDDCRRLGILPFAHLARGAFVAMALLKSAVKTGILTQGQMDNFLRSLDSVTSGFKRKLARVARGESSWESLLEEYGHLRPGTYEITAPSYAQDPERFLRPLLNNTAGENHSPNASETWHDETLNNLARQMESAGMPVSPDKLGTFLRQAITGREMAKFHFTRNLSAALEALAEFGSEHGLSREEVSHLGLTDLRGLAGGDAPNELSAWLRERSDEGAKWHVLAQGIELPSLIKNPGDLRGFMLPGSQPNFITSRVSSARLLVIRDEIPSSEELDGAIVLIQQADPGYDWLFGHSIAGLITTYGGANSHMAIRAAELDLPAAVGVGEKWRQVLEQAQIVCLDCQHRRLAVIE